MKNMFRSFLVVSVSCVAISCVQSVSKNAGPSFVDITWMSMANVHYQIGDIGIVTDGYFSRLPLEDFYGGGGGLERTRKSHISDVNAVRDVLAALGGSPRINLLLTGHSHFDHSFDIGTWAQLTRATIYGSQTTCFQAIAANASQNRCIPVFGGELIQIADAVEMHVVRWNHSGDAQRNPEQHNPVELDAPPVPDQETGGFRAGVAEDFPNGGGSRGYLFVVRGPDGPYSWFYQGTASAIDLHLPIIVSGINYGSPLENLTAAMTSAQISSVDLWIGNGSAAVAQLVLPILKPKHYLPIHWDGLDAPFRRGLSTSFSDSPLEATLAAAEVELIEQFQYMDKWRLDTAGIQQIDNYAAKQALGFSNGESE